MTPSIAHRSDYIIFLVGIIPLFTLDLFLSRTKEAISLSKSKAFLLSCLWITASASFAIWIWSHFGTTVALEYTTGYLIELALSVDNLFVFLLIFRYFSVPQKAERRVLTWGIFGALMMRAGFIFIGAALIKKFFWVTYLLGALLIFSSIKLMRGGLGANFSPEQNGAFRFLRRVIPFTKEFHGERFIVKASGSLLFTPLLLVVVVIETTDLLFAFDSIPAIFGITHDPFIIFTSNMAAVIGLRSFYTVVSQALLKLRFLNQGLATVLGFIGVEMLISGAFKIPIEASLSVVLLVLVITAVLSRIFKGQTIP